ncbi:hypothetical protein BBIA_0283 [Bifidobacterium biavatii DSM 23969]|uniref:Asp-tRNAAsn/Glu-tRNAGln amidotransferase A subunit n=2 Tax=Bifidobacterium biavatii TaxID=762212 RepID=A0A087A1F3_9BIFI|nr:hypothetical protein BBIA_0283 [Bifidobacterium biavatii DSM 23969]
MSPSRRAWIMRGLITPIFGLLAVTCIVLGLFNATIWKPSSEITAKGTVSGVHYAATDPGVLPLVDDDATLTVTASGSDVCVALGSSKDVNGWINGESYARVTGLSDWTTLSTEVSDATQGASSGDDSQDVAFKDSDMWTRVVCGSGKATLKTTAKDKSEIALIDLGDADQATVSVHWVRETLPDFAMPFYFAGGLLALMAVLTASLFAMPPHKRRKRVIESKLVQEEVTVAQAISGSLARIMPSRRPRGERRRHAGTGVRGERAETGTTIGSAESHYDAQPAQPTIIDPSSRNLVADQAARNAQAEREPAGQDDYGADRDRDAQLAQPDLVLPDGAATDDRFAPVEQPESALRFDAVDQDEPVVPAAADDRRPNDDTVDDAAAATIGEQTVEQSAERSSDQADDQSAVSDVVPEAMSGATDAADETHDESHHGDEHIGRVAQSTPDEPAAVQPSLPRRRRRHSAESNHAEDTANNDVTSVISNEELQAYFARLAQETAGAADDDRANNDGKKEERQ